MLPAGIDSNYKKQEEFYASEKYQTGAKEVTILPHE